jgi:hypothetical protein
VPIGSSTSHDDPHIDKKLTASCARCATGCVRARSVWRARALRPPMSRAACPAPPHHIFSARGRRCCRALVEGCSAVLSCMTTSERYIKDPRLTEQTTKSRFCTPWVFERPRFFDNRGRVRGHGACGDEPTTTSRERRGHARRVILPVLTCSSLHPHQPLTRPHLTVHSIFARVCAHPIDTRCLCACCAADVTRATRPGTMQHHAFFALWCASRFDSDARQFHHPPRLDDQHRHQQDPDTKQYKLTTSTSSRSREDYIMYI